MGFTPLEGLVMATRSGSVDPGLLLWLLEHEELSAGELAEALEHRSGLLGPGRHRRHARDRASEWRGRRSDEDRPSRAPGPGRLRAPAARRFAAMAAALGGLDALVFTGGVGEHSARSVG